MQQHGTDNVPASESTSREYGAARIERKIAQIVRPQSHLDAQLQGLARNRGRPSGSPDPNPTMPIGDHIRGEKPRRQRAGTGGTVAR